MRVSTIISFVLGTTVGSVATYFVVKEKTKEKYKKEMNESIDKYLKHVEGKEDDGQILVPDSGENMDIKEKVDKSIAESAETYFETGKYVYNPVSDTTIRRITKDEFGYDAAYGRIPLTWFPEDDIIADDMMVACGEDELDSMLGVKNPLQITDMYNVDLTSPGHDDVIYICNDELRIYYELTIDDRTFDEAKSRITRITGGYEEDE